MKMLLSGSTEEIDIQDWKNNTEYQQGNKNEKVRTNTNFPHIYNAHQFLLHNFVFCFVSLFRLLFGFGNLLTHVLVLNDVNF